MPERTQGGFDHVDTWIFDLDNTLYPAHCDLFSQVSQRMSRFVADLLGVSRQTVISLERGRFDPSLPLAFNLANANTTGFLGEGLKFSSLGDLQQSFDKNDRKPMIPHLALAMLTRFGALPGQRSGAVKLVRA